MKYDLRYEPWINCEFPDGTHRHVGFVELFEKAHEIMRFYHDNPLAEASLMRILLALSHRIVDGPKDKRAWKEAYGKGRFDEKALRGYFEKWVDRFDLFSSEYPFMQTAGLSFVDEKTKLPKEPLPLSLLVHHIASGNNVTLFDHSIDDVSVAYAPSEAVYTVLVAHAYGLGGIHKKSSNFFGYEQNCKHGSQVNGYQVFVGGETLFETLMLNTLTEQFAKPMHFGTSDMPYWESPTKENGDTLPRGYLDYLTFTGRHIRLVPDAAGRVSSVHFACGRSFAVPFKEPFIPTKTTKEGERALNFSLEKALWRDSDTLFRYSCDDFVIAPFAQLKHLGSRELARGTYGINGYGIVNDKASPLSYRKETLPLSVELLEEESMRIKVISAISTCEEAAGNLRNAMNTFGKTAELKIDGPKKEAEVLYWSALELPFKEQLRNVADDAYLSRWETTVQKALRSAYDTATNGLMAERARGLRAYVEGEKRLYFKKKGGEYQQ